MAQRITGFRRDGLDFDVVDSGPVDGEIAVLLHGFPQHHTSWDAVAPLLHDQGLRTLVPDQRGYSPGARPRGRRAYRTHELVADVAMLLATADVGAAHVVGHDWGAAVGWAMGMTRADLVRSLTAVSVPHPGAIGRAMLTSSQGRKSWYMAAAQVPGLAERMLDPARPDSRERFVTAMVKGGQDRHAAERDAEFLSSPGAFSAALAWYRAIPLNPSGTLRAHVAAPTAMVWGDADTAIGPAGVHATAAYVDGPYHLVVLAGASHWVPQQHPDAVADAVRTVVADSRTT
jgi:pimeloyl-ACP methyl ester carboxylesterase